MLLNIRDVKFVIFLTVVVGLSLHKLCTDVCNKLRCVTGVERMLTVVVTSEEIIWFSSQFVTQQIPVKNHFWFSFVKVPNQYFHMLQLQLYLLTVNFNDCYSRWSNY